MFGFILDYAKLHKCEVDIYNHPDAITPTKKKNETKQYKDILI